MKKLLIIDGNAIVHRAFHAFPKSLTLPGGELINAVYGFFSILIKAIDEIKPEYLVICFDRPAPTFRKLLFAGYQANRPKMADVLSQQISLLHKLLGEIGIPIFEIDGYEADDIIGTLSVQAKKHNIETIILSGDRDLLQLVNNMVKLLAPVTGITKFIMFDEKAVLEKYGVKPSQVTDYKALIGDSSDGYPGVNGIGPKTAQELLRKYDSFENLYKQIRDLPEKTALKLATNAEQGSLAKKLATITLDVPVKLNFSFSSMDHFNREKVEKIFNEYKFNSLKKRLVVFKSFNSLNDGKKENENQLKLI